MAQIRSMGAASTRSAGFTVKPICSIPASGSITQSFGLGQYQYGNPTIFTWTRSGSTLNYSISSATTYCGSTKTTTGSTPIVITGFASTFTGSISGDVLTVSSTTAGIIAVGQTITGAGITAGTTIIGLAGSVSVPQGTIIGAGGVGNYTVSISQTVASTSMAGYTPANILAEAAYTPGWNHAKDCCNGNQNNITEYYSLVMTSPSVAVLSGTGAYGTQSGC